ncbi:MAG: hypothetical protein ACLFVX_10135 [Archaeoglobaceae archaeon]
MNGEIIEEYLDDEPCPSFLTEESKLKEEDIDELDHLVKRSLFKE